MSESSQSSRAQSPNAPPQRVVSGSLKERIAKFENLGAGGNVPAPRSYDRGPSYARGGIVGNRIPSLDPKTAGLAGNGARRVSERRELIGNRIPSSGSPSWPPNAATGAGSRAHDTSTTSDRSSSSGSGRSAGDGGGRIGLGRPPSSSGRSFSPAHSATDSASTSSAASAVDSAQSGSAPTSRTSSPATSPGPAFPAQLGGSLPDQGDAGAMTPSSTRADMGEDISDMSMPTTPVAGSSDLPAPGYDLVPGSLMFAASTAAVAPPASLASSLRSEYNPVSEGEESLNLKDVSGVSTPTGTPRQAHRGLEDDASSVGGGSLRSVGASSVAGSSRARSEIGDIDTKISGLHLDAETSKANSPAASKDVEGPGGFSEPALGEVSTVSDVDDNAQSPTEGLHEATPKAEISLDQAVPLAGMTSPPADSSELAAASAHTEPKVSPTLESKSEEKKPAAARVDEANSLPAALAESMSTRMLAQPEESVTSTASPVQLKTEREENSADTPVREKSTPSAADADNATPATAVGELTEASQTKEDTLMPTQEADDEASEVERTTPTPVVAAVAPTSSSQAGSSDDDEKADTHTRQESTAAKDVGSEPPTEPSSQSKSSTDAVKVQPADADSKESTTAGASVETIPPSGETDRGASETETERGSQDPKVVSDSGSTLKETQPHLDSAKNAGFGTKVAESASLDDTPPQPTLGTPEVNTIEPDTAREAGVSAVGLGVPPSLRVPDSSTADERDDHDTQYDRDITPHASQFPRHESSYDMDREATPVPDAFMDGNTSDVSQPPPALDDDSDIVSVMGGAMSERDIGSPMASNRSSMPPARASSELEFRFEDLHERFFRDSKPELSSPQSAGEAVPLPSAATERAHQDGPRSTAQQQQDLPDGLSGLPTAAAVAGIAGVHAVGGNSTGGSGTDTTANVAQQASAGGSDNEVVAVEQQFPAVPSTVLEGSPSRRPLQVHVEPSPYGVIGKQPEVDPTSERLPDPSPTHVGAVSDNPSPPSETEVKTVPDFPKAPRTNLATASTPADSSPHTPLQSSFSAGDAQLQGLTPMTPGVLLSFPEVPDETHPYVGVHVSPTRSSLSGPDHPRIPFPRNNMSGTPSPTEAYSRRSTGGDASSPSVVGLSGTGTRTSITPPSRHQAFATGAPPFDSPSANLSAETLEFDREPGNRSPARKRNSFSPRSPHLHDEDPGDFEPGEGWALVSKWEPWRGGPPP